MNINDLYRSQDDKVFRIIGLDIEGENFWVTYKNTQTDQEYSCLQEAFLLRFSPQAQSR